MKGPSFSIFTQPMAILIQYKADWNIKGKIPNQRSQDDLVWTVFANLGSGLSPII